MDHNSSDFHKRFIFSGTPGSGKTSIINLLDNRGYNIIQEAATDIIKEEQANGNPEPWQNSEFIDKIIALQKQRQLKANGSLQFYDRSPFCTYALALYANFKPSQALLAEVDRCLKSKVYSNQVIFFKNLGFIKHTDARKISYEDALIFEKIHLKTYKDFGFEIIFIPKNSIYDRCKFILNFCKIS